jgi:hypothetical protein
MPLPGPASAPTTEPVPARTECHLSALRWLRLHKLATSLHTVS